MREVYADNNATTRVAPEVKEAMLPFFEELYGNPSSIHLFGEKTARHLDAAREQTAGFLGAHPDEIVFTSCGTESNNAAVRGTLACCPDKRHIVTTQVEHPAVLSLCRQLKRNGCEITELSVDRSGQLDLDELKNSLREDTALVSIMFANNETGVIFPVEEIAQIVKSRGIVFHCDAVQAIGKVPINLSQLPIDFLSLSGHKFHAPKGIGVLYVRKGTRFVPFLVGGHQEKGRRAGTENIPYIVGLAKACETAETYFGQSKVQTLRDRLEEGLLQRIPNTKINGDRDSRLPNTANISFEAVEGEAMMLHLNNAGIAVSTGSACGSGDLGPSHVLRAMEVPASLINGSIRFSLSRYNCEEDIDYIIEKAPPIVNQLREMSPMWPVGNTGRSKE